MIQTLRAIIREELDRRREPALALVTEVFTVQIEAIGFGRGSSNPDPILNCRLKRF